MNEIITSKNNPNIKYTKKLLTQPRFRKDESAFVIEGVRLCCDALGSAVEVQTVFYTEKCLIKFTNIVNEIIGSAKNSFTVSEEVVKLISDTDAPQGLVCVCKNGELHEQIDFAKNIVLLENIQNPSNLGSILRTCDAMNAKNIIISGDSCDIYSPKVLRGSMGAVFRLNVKVSEDFQKSLLDLKSKNYKIYATVPSQNAKILGESEVFNEKSAVVFGNEGVGVTDKTLSLCDEKITIPMNRNSESLNVSVAAGIVIWEMAKKGGF